jgi:cell division protein FtsB
VAAPRTSRARANARRRRLIGGRVLIVAVATLVAFLYYRPLTSYVQTRSDVQRRQDEVASLHAEKARLEQKLARSNGVSSLRREARRIGYVRPGERLFIVKGVEEWRRASVR